MQTQEPIVYQGQFGSFTIDDHDRQGVLLYRGGLAIAALSFAIATGLVLLQNTFWITPLYFVFWTALGVSLFTIHIYVKPLHLALQAFWMIGGLASIALLFVSSDPMALYVYQHPIWILGTGFTFASLTGIFFKEAFCSDRFETKLLTPIVPLLLLGHLVGWLPILWEKALLAAWSALFLVFAIRKLIQPIPPDIGDKSVFEYLKTTAKSKATT
ncbi:DUF2301 domain-containing membrane protein [Leptolyngbya sp. NIES-2104]|uniref:DUF2301 domain-containing membrane protein n=1 Tax=Leptolyngbya sp. NIES-2104 TaxID=1552121 RepID=UPI0006EC8536|nr:DUF2301 domain-containing membrane protein [Leptolyngbya sp. NIES-2104]GAP98544.1 permease of the major facilitator superfamily [Leptolyngbya sp. NIES-2104]